MSFIKSLLPTWFLRFMRPFYHGAMAFLASFYFGRPSNKLLVIGITGTAGKSTTAAMLADILNRNGRKCGLVTTVDFFDGNSSQINKHGLSMPGGWLLQQSLSQMVRRGCKYAIVECTSEGLAQNRHLGIKFYAALFTNLSAAHLEAHQGFANYRAAKGKLFKAAKVIGVNLDDAAAEYFLHFPAEKKFGISFEDTELPAAPTKYLGLKTATGFRLKGVEFSINMPGDFNKYNALLAAACADVLGVRLAQAAAALSNFQGVRGRMEPVPNNRGLNILVDYGCEPASFKAALKAAAVLPHGRLFHVFGSTGGHRDKSKRFEFGKISSQYADYIIVTNDDVYDSDAKEIADSIVTGIKTNQLRQPGFEIILDRRAAIARALSVAQTGDLVLITGKGSEQFLVLPGNNRVEWDDCTVVREELSKIEHNLNN